MNSVILKCPLCCNKGFSSKIELSEHLNSVLEHLSCSICNTKWSSIALLIEHLTLDNCQPDGVDIIFDINTASVNNEMVPESSNCHLDALTDNKLLDIDENDKANLDHSFTTTDHQANILEGPEMGKMYVEFLSKPLSKPCIQTQELKLVKENGVSRYVVVTNEDDELGIGSTVVTKQNQDGTISLTTVIDTKLEPKSEAAMTEDLDLEDQQEIYSCSSCGVSFTSVVDHIKSYHNDQDVVVEEQTDDLGNDSITIYNSRLTEEMPNDKQIRRMITETGDIVEAPLVAEVLKPVSGLNIAPNEMNSKEMTQVKENLSNQKISPNVVIENDLNAQEKQSGSFHKVVMKEMQTIDGQRVKVYNCMICKVYVSSLEEFKSRPCNTLKYPCPRCPVAYENAKSLNAHMKVHKGDRTNIVPGVKAQKDPTAASVIYECSVCATIFPTHKSLKLHKRMHNPIKSRPIEPPVEMHDGTEVSKDKFLCSICNKLIPMDYREIHQNSHKDIETFNCDICNKKFSGQDYLEMHLNAHSVDKGLVAKQDESLPYRCLYCDRRFARPHEKVKHERIHTGEKPHSCEICGKAFRVSYCLTLHMRTHTGARPYACTHCGKRFKAHSVYNHHLLTHSEVRAYKCPYCPKAFKTSVQLAGHKNSHTKPFSCQQCNRPFASLYAVRVHTETHSRQNNLKFSCALCGASYARAFALKDHIKQVHNQEDAK